ncbi:MAG: hypothetical protein ACRENU_05125 [Gemmatimonadaceae bacterium]
MPLRREPRQHLATLPLGLLSLLVALTSGCVTVPHAAPELSGQLTGRIQEVRAAHVRLIRMFMDEKRAAVDRFMDTEWVPRFATELFERPTVAAEWDKIVQSRDTEQRLRFIAGLGPRLQLQINRKRQELVSPLDETERAIIRRIEDEYNTMLAINATLTGLLEAAAKASDTQTRIRTQLDPGDKLQGYLTKAEEIAQLLVDKTADLPAQKAKVDALIKELKTP